MVVGQSSGRGGLAKASGALGVCVLTSVVRIWERAGVNVHSASNGKG